MTSRRTKAAQTASQLKKEAAATVKPVRLTEAEIEALQRDKVAALDWLANRLGRRVRRTSDLPENDGKH